MRIPGTSPVSFCRFSFTANQNLIYNNLLPQYYVEGNHEAIIDPAVFDAVQALLRSRSKSKHRQSSAGLFSSRIKCGCCGDKYDSKLYDEAVTVTNKELSEKPMPKKSIRQVLKPKQTQPKRNHKKDELEL